MASPPPAPAAPHPLEAAAAAPAPKPATPPPYVPDNSDAAYTGPPPIPVTASSSTPGPAAPEPAAPSSSGAGGDEVQLGALNSSDDAERAWRDISGATPALFNGKQPDIQPATVNGKTYYRLRVGGFSSKADAATFCAEVSAAGNACTVANF